MTGEIGGGGSAWSRRRVLGGAGAAALGGALLAACGAGTGATGAESGAARSAQPVTLEFLHRWEGARTEVIERVVGAYRQQHPNVQINNQLVFGNGDGFFDGMPYDKILAQIAAGTPPDVIMMGSDVAAAWARRGGVLRPLDEPFRRDNVDPNKVFYPALAQMARAAGKYQGLPQLTATDRAYLFANKDVVEAAGLDAAKGPAGWDELVAWSQRVTRREGDALSQVGLDIGGTPFIDWLTRNDGRVLSEDGSKVTFDGPAGQATLEWMLDSTKRLYGSQQAYGEFVKAQRNATYTGKVNLWIGQAAQFFVVMADGPKAKRRVPPGGERRAPQRGQRPGEEPLAGREDLDVLPGDGRERRPRRRRLRLPEVPHPGGREPAVRPRPGAPLAGGEGQRRSGLQAGQPLVGHGGEAGPRPDDAHGPDAGLERDADRPHRHDRPGAGRAAGRARGPGNAAAREAQTLLDNSKR